MESISNITVYLLKIICLPQWLYLKNVTIQQCIIHQYCLFFYYLHKSVNWILKFINSSYFHVNIVCLHNWEKFTQLNKSKLNSHIFSL